MRAPAPPAERAPEWDSVPGLVHGFFGRRGGSSAPPWNGLNLSLKVGDSPQRVSANWEATRDALAPLRLTRMDQVHGVDIIEVGPGQAADHDRIACAGDADGLATRVPGIGLVVMTADCVPILMVARERRVAFALHAGWRGTLGGIASRAVDRGARAFGIAADEWEIAIGPAIEACCYEVDADIGERIESQWGEMPGAWERRGDKGQLDLRQVNSRILERSGARPQAIRLVGGCTACNPGKYFSHRASGGKTGRQASIIGFVEAA